MPGYIVAIICLIILTLTGSLKAPCAAAGLSLWHAMYILVCVLALTRFNINPGVEVCINCSAIALLLLPQAFMPTGKGDNGSAAGMTVLISVFIALLQRSGLLYGGDNGVLCGLIAGFSCLMLWDSPSAAAATAAGIPIFTAIADSFLSMLMIGYTSLYIGGEALTSQLIALCTAVIILWIGSLTSAAENDL